MKRVFMIACLIVFTSLCSATDNWTINIMGNTGNDVVLGAGRTLNSYQAEVGIGMTMYEVQEPKVSDNITIGPYIAIPFQLPGNWSKDVGSYAGVSPQIHTRTGKPAFELFGAIVLYPGKNASPVLLGRYNWIDSGISDSSAVESGGMALFGLRIRTK